MYIRRIAYAKAICGAAECSIHQFQIMSGFSLRSYLLAVVVQVTGGGEQREESAWAAHRIMTAPTAAWLR